MSLESQFPQTQEAEKAAPLPLRSPKRVKSTAVWAISRHYVVRSTTGGVYLLGPERGNLAKVRIQPENNS